MARAAIACALFLCVVAPSHVAVADDPPAAAIDAYNRGVDEQAKGDQDGAIADFAKAIEIDPRFKEAYVGRGNAKRTKGDLDGAIADFTKAIEIDPRYAKAHQNRGAAKRDMGDLDGAIADSTMAIEIDPRYVKAYYNRGAAKSDKGDQDGAIADCTKAIGIDPRYKDAYITRGVAKRAKGDQDGAIADSTKAIEIDPRYTKAYYSRGNARFASRDFPGATADLKKAIDLDAAHDYARFFLFLSEAAGVEGMVKARENLKARRAARGKPMEEGSWVETVDRFLGGEIPAEGLSKAVDASSEEDRTGNRCGSFFYSGMLLWLRGDKAAAEERLLKCVETGKTTSTECGVAKAVLAWPK